MRTAKNLLLPLLCAFVTLAGTNCLRADSPATFKVADIMFVRPPSWDWTELAAGSMRKAQLKVKDAAGKETAEVIFFEFPGGAGSVQANVDRWLGQFEEPREKINSKVEEATVGKTKVTYVQAEGTYKSGMPGSTPTPMPNYALVGAIVETAENNIFIRMTGPKALTKASVAEFKKMVESGLKKK